MFGFYAIKRYRNAIAVVILCATFTKPASHKRLGIYLSGFSELTTKFTNIIKTNF